MINIAAYAINYDTSLDVSYHLIGIAMDQAQYKIKALRTKMGWTQEELARQIYVSLATVQRWEANKVSPSRLALKELNKLFKKASIQ